MPQHKIGEPHLSCDFGVGVSIALEIDQEMDSAASPVNGVGQFAIHPDSVLADRGPGFGQQFPDVGHHSVGIVGKLAAVDQEHAFIIVLRHGCRSLG